MMVYCSALNCQNATSGVYKNSTVSFYGFPLRNKPLLKQWIHNMGRDIGTPSKPLFVHDSSHAWKNFPLESLR
uniref:THAP-type domain-containing protein n=1 Tax=Athene cunicularia TaxID=194338 RepID=A0A663MC55_ATHCN